VSLNSDDEGLFWAIYVQSPNSCPLSARHWNWVWLYGTSNVAGFAAKATEDELNSKTSAIKKITILFTLSHRLSFNISLLSLDLEHSANQLNDALIPAVQ
jgi:hypothetical protein